MKHRGRAIFALILGIAVLVGFTVMAYAATKMPEKDIVIESKDVFTKMKKGPVTFSHEKHKAAKCTTCHHEFKDGKNVWQEGQEVKKCSTCHKLKPEGKVVKLELAYHNKCMGCHKEMKKEKKKTGPTACNKCHAGGKEEKAQEGK